MVSTILRMTPSLLLATVTVLAQPRFYPDDPLVEDPDRLDVAGKPATIELSDLYDRFSNIFHDFGTSDRLEAENVNTLDEVPDSSWFTNRHGIRRMSVEELIQGPNSPDGRPAFPWTILKGKSDGLTPGFHIQDAKGRRYVVKLDGKGHPGLNSAAEVISTRIFHALGYNVPENYIVTFHPEDLSIQEGTRIRDEFGDQVELTRRLLARLLEKADRTNKGRIRALASRYIEGQPLGPFRYFGTRSDDPNDVFLHENRRELRGLRVFSAWLNHDDTRAQNTLDTWVEEGGRHFIRHYLIDFGSTLGAGYEDLLVPNNGYYWMDLGSIKKAALRFGLFTPPYRKIRWPAETMLPSVGCFESKSFDPDEWRNEYPNPAFIRMSDRDAFWAARIVMRFTPRELRAIVSTGEFEDPRAENYVFSTLTERQFKIGRTYLNRLNPIGEFLIRKDRLEFANLAEDCGAAQPGAVYQLVWSVYDNSTGRVRKMIGAFEQENREITIPKEELREDDYLRLEIRTVSPRHRNWHKAVTVYLKPDSGSYRPVGIERQAWG